MFSVCSTLYGNYFGLAHRLLSSIRHFDLIKDIRLGLNAVSEETKAFVLDWARQNSCYCPVYVFEDHEQRNLGKYPLMRQMFAYRPLADKVMWFDDDSYLDDAIDLSWWQAAEQAATKATQIGALHVIMQRGKQHEVIVQQPWYNLKIVNQRHRFRFATGGWWVADSFFLRLWDYPFVDLYHNGGDSILGELIRQQGKTLTQFSQLQCHCEACRIKGIQKRLPVVHVNVGGRKGRRGIGVTDEKYVWSDGNPAPSREHQNFSLRAYNYGV